jgi:hypothetical protein
MKMPVLIILSMIMPILASQNSTIDMRTIDSLKQRIGILEGVKENYTKDIENNKNALKNQYDLFVNEIKKDNTLIKWILSIIGIIGLSTIIGSIFYLRKYASKKAKETLDTAFNNKADEIEELIRIKNEDYQLKTKKRILVITPSYSDKQFLINFFKKMDFNIDNIEYELFPQKEIKNKFDIIIFNDEKGKPATKDKSQEQIDIEEFFIATPSKALRFYYGPKRLSINDIAIQNILSYANTPLQLYGNLMNALRYQDKLM